MSALRKILWQRLNADMSAVLGPEWSRKKIVIYGAGGMGLSFMQTFPQLSIAYAIDSNPRRAGEIFHGMRIEMPECLKTENPDDVVVFITSSWHQEIRRTLESFGLTMNRHFFFGNQHAHGRLFFYLHDMTNFRPAFSWLEEHAVNHVILRWFETLPEETPTDIDVLVQTDHLEKLFDNPYLDSEPGGIPLEIYWSRPLGQEDELLYYPPWLAERILASRRRSAAGLYVPDDDCYLKSLAYHVVFHKAERAGWPVGEGGSPPAADNKYLTKIRELSAQAELEPEFTLEGMWDFLETVGWLPPVDLARRYAVALKSPWLSGKLAPAPDNDNDVLVYVYRDWLLDHSGIMEQVTREIEALGLQCIDIVTLTSAEKERARTLIRGGNWVETEESRAGGGPAAFAVFFDPAPERPSPSDLLLRPFCNNRKLGEKTELKQWICRQADGGRIVNFLHAADDEREGMEYLRCLEQRRYERLLDKVDSFRTAAVNR